MEETVLYHWQALPLHRQLRRAYQHLRAAHAQAAKTDGAGAFGWLLDNFPLLQKEYRQALATLAGARDPAGLGELVDALGQKVCAPRQPIEYGVLHGALSPVRGGRPSHEQLCLLEGALRMALLLCAAQGAACPRGPEAAQALSYAVGGLYAAGSVEFGALARSLSPVEKILLEDPAGVYPAMDGESRAQYRRAVWLLAGRRGLPEEEVARRALVLAGQGEASPKNHVGYFLLNDPLFTRRRARRGYAYLLGVPAGAAALGLACGLLTGSAAAGLLALLPAWEIAAALVARLCAAGLEPAMLPRLDFSALPREERGAAVVLTTLLEPADDGKKLEERLRSLYFANRKDCLTFCLLADLPAAPQPAAAQDESLVRLARDVVEGLNARYGSRFFLLVRARSYCKTQNTFTGAERKRGAICALVRYMKGEEINALCAAGDFTRLRAAKRLIVLDADTCLHFGTAPLLIATAAHPLNRPAYSPDGKRVVSGYGVLVPRLAPALAGEGATPFLRVMAGCGGVSGYEKGGRDLWQDLFGQAVFTGKGIVDVECFYRQCCGVFPPQQVLSHDILEGGAMGCAFVGDVEMTDSEPRSLLPWLRRQHRWMRGDWQNLVFLKKHFRLGQRVYTYSPCRGVVRCQLAGNLRRALAPAASLACVLAAPLLPGGGLLCALGALSAAFAPLWGAAALALRGGPFALARRLSGGAMPQVFTLLGRAALLLITLPARALLAADAAARSLWRTFVSRKNLLEWTTAAQGERAGGALLKSCLLPECLGLLLLFLGEAGCLRALGLLFSLLLPAAHFTGRPAQQQARGLSPGQEGEVRALAADMVRFFTGFATPQRHCLPPDNVQVSPRFAVAERTSPTNIGFMLLSLLAARDFGLLSTAEMYRRVRGTVDTLLLLEKWHGNLYNWYDVRTLAPLPPAFVSSVDSGNLFGCLVALKEGLREFSHPGMEALARDIEALIHACDLRPFYNAARRLFSIGFDCESGQMSGSHYDFLMSEARLLSYAAIGAGQVPRRHWGALSRAMSRCGRRAGPVSWTGTMFEYFMPQLLLPAPAGSLLGEALNYCLHCQRRRGRRAGTPWGISESGYYAFDTQLNYQYKAHGVQALGVKRGLNRDLVLAPYATFLALPLAPGAALRNLERLRGLGLYGAYGFYEAADFTPGRCEGAPFMPVRSFMAHHLGMSLTALANAAFGGVMQRRFLRDAAMGSAREFLEERLETGSVVYENKLEKDMAPLGAAAPGVEEHCASPSPLAPRAALLGNGALCEVFTDVGAGFLKYGDTDLTRRGQDLLEDPCGVFCLMECGGTLLSPTPAPLYPPGESSTLFSPQSVCQRGRRGGLSLEAFCYIDAAAGASVRKITARTTGAPRRASLLLYLEPVLARQADFAAHPAFSRLFVVCRLDRALGALHFCRRRQQEGPGAHLYVGLGEDIPFAFETDKQRLLAPPAGVRGLAGFAAMPFSSEPYSSNAVCALRAGLRLAPGAPQTLHLILAAGDSAQQAQRAFLLARQGLHGGAARAPSPLLDQSAPGALGTQLLGQLLYGLPMPAAAREAAARNVLGQAGLWPLGVSGDLPIALLPPACAAPGLVLAYTQLLDRLRRRDLPFDLVVLAPDAQTLCACRSALTGAGLRALQNARGGVYLLEDGALEGARRTLLYAVACHVAQPGAPQPLEAPPFLPAPVLPAAPEGGPPAGLAVYGGTFGRGCFTVSRRGHTPYGHILANPAFGTLVTDCSLGFTWAVNAREGRLTPWPGEAAGPHRGERLLLKIDGALYDPLTGARAAFSPGAARWEGRAGGLKMLLEVRLTGCAKVLDLTLWGGEAQSLVQAVYAIEPVLGVGRATSRLLRGRATPEGFLVEAPYNTAVPSALCLCGGQREWRYLCDRRALLAGDWAGAARPPAPGPGADTPGGLPGADPCCALLLPLVLNKGATARLRLVLAWGHDAPSAQKMARLALGALPIRPTVPAGADGPDKIEIDTPDRYLNALVNTLLPHQVLASRVRGRTGLYQCSGAYGFRDQLQDVCNLCILDPGLARAHIARCCAVQFRAGDVLHWWHRLPAGTKGRPGGGLWGVRTRCGDDMCWLPWAIADYAEKTGDLAFLTGPAIAYLEGEELAEGERSRYFSPTRAAARGSIYQHGLRALERSHRLSPRGLVRMGGGDWNDGFDGVGAGGKGESVWLTLFLKLVCGRYAALAGRVGDTASQALLSLRAAALGQAVDEHCWDGQWYLRATFDNGETLGSAENRECRIDLLPQAFAALAGLPDAGRVDTALTSALRHLVDEENMLVRLFTPPFEDSDPSPGYVQAYPAGVRENGGQYTHAALWLALALLRRGRCDEGYRLLQLLNPAFRGSDASLAARYGLEPYYLAADISAGRARHGRGGWSMYTGAAGWYLSTAVSGLLGVELRGGALEIHPRLPAAWPGAAATCRLRGTTVRITVRRGARQGLLLDGVPAGHIPLDGGRHEAVVTV